MTESISYQFVNFVAEVGGYLGLLLGASLLDMYDSSRKCIKYIALRYKNQGEYSV
jgi:hypothetical protein